MCHAVTLLAAALIAAEPEPPVLTPGQIVHYVRQQGGVASYMADCDRPALHLVLSGLLATDADVRKLARAPGIGALDL